VPASVRKSQSQEDEHLLSFFGGFCGGTYVELGALDGITFSNTYAFNKALGWKGVLIELSPATFARLRANRPDELAVVNAVVCKEEGMVHYLDNPKGQAVNGIWELASPKFRDFWWRGKTIDDTTPVRCRPLRSILGEVSDAERDRRFLRAQSRREIGCPPSPVDICCRDSFIPTFTGTHTRVDRSFICRQVLSSYPHIPKSHAHSPTRTRPRARPLTQVRDPFFADFLSLDVEGAELQVLESLDFRRSAFGIVLVEADTGNRSKNEGVRRLLVENG
jgi:hypothetical protein